jgi:hypothetical protein
MDGVDAGRETSVPGADGRLLPDLTDHDATFEQAAPRGLKIGDDDVHFRTDATGASVSPMPIWIEQLEPGGVSCTTRNTSFGA